MASSFNPEHAAPASARSRSPPLLSHFFRIIVDHEVHSKKLPLPRKYAQFSFGAKAILEIPSGDQWEVDITRDKEGISWFCGNWDAFYAFYSINYGHVLLFRNIGSSRFSVVIFNLTACEIEYPIRNTANTNTQRGAHSGQGLNDLAENNNATTEPANEAIKIEEEANPDYKETQSVPSGSPVHHFQSNNPFFRINLMNCSLSAKKSLRLSREFSDQLSTTSITIRMPTGDMWEDDSIRSIRMIQSEAVLSCSVSDELLVGLGADPPLDGRSYGRDVMNDFILEKLACLLMRQIVSGGEIRFQLLRLEVENMGYQDKWDCWIWYC
ncbi:B3 domain-containing protein At1g49475 [Linum perenne]